MKLTKAERAIVHDKFGGLCAYCGFALPDRWHADHFKAVQRRAVYVRGKGLVPNGEADWPENHRMDNMMPSCPPCNISKGSLQIEEWRKWLAGHLASLNRHNTPYRLMKVYGLVQETGLPITFYFERARLGGKADEVPR